MSAWASVRQKLRDAVLVKKFALYAALQVWWGPCAACAAQLALVVAWALQDLDPTVSGTVSVTILERFFARNGVRSRPCRAPLCNRELPASPCRFRSVRRS